MPTTISGTDGVSAVVDGTIVAADIASDAVTTAKILNANVTPAKLSQPLTFATAQAITSGTNIDFTGIPSWVKRITIIFSGVSTNANSLFVVQLGTPGGLQTTNYVSFAGYYTGAGGAVSSVTNGFGWHNNTNDVGHGHMIITNISSNLWVSSHSGGFTNGSTNFMQAGGGSVTMSGTVDRVRITTVSGTAIFDAGSINISYEG